MIDRRGFIGTLTGSLLAAPLAAEAQQAGKVSTVALLSIGTDPARSAQWQPFFDAMHQLGFIEALAEAADLLGFSGLSSLSRWFSARFDCSASAWRAAHRGRMVSAR